MQLAVRSLARTDRTAAQMEQFLPERGPRPGRQGAVGRLTSFWYLDDVAFAERWADRRWHAADGARASEGRTARAGIPEHIVEAADEATAVR